MRQRTMLAALVAATVVAVGAAPERKRLLLVFASPSCGPCRALLPDVARRQRTYADRLSVAVAIDAGADEARAEARRDSL